MAGQVAYHLLAQAGATRAPWPVTTIVSCLPVLVLAMGTAVAHMLRGDTAMGLPDTRTRASGRPPRTRGGSPKKTPACGSWAGSAPHTRVARRRSSPPPRAAGPPRTRGG
jgi:hypothetical protein